MDPNQEEILKTHQAVETVALLLTVPLLAWVAFQRDIPPKGRALAAGAAASVTLIDGYLLSKYARQWRSA